MRSRTPKRAKKDRECRKIEAEWRAKHVFCWVCGTFLNEYGIHHFATGNRHAAIDQPCCFFAACYPDNSGVLEDRSVWPLPRVLATKWHYDKEWYDRPKFLSIIGRAETAITADEVRDWWQKDYGDGQKPGQGTLFETNGDIGK